MSPTKQNSEISKVHYPHLEEFLRPPLNYVASLDAMHEAEKIFNLDQRCQYSYQLTKLASPPYTDLGPCFATAAQKAKAFLKTIGKWTDEPSTKSKS